MPLFTSIYSTAKCGLGLKSILAFFQYWQTERAVIYNHKTHVDDGLSITWSSDNINTCSGGADKPSLRFEGSEWYNCQMTRRYPGVKTFVEITQAHHFQDRCVFACITV